MQHIRRELRFSVDETTGDIEIRVVDAVTDALVRRIPLADVLTLVEPASGAQTGRSTAPGG